TRESPSIEEPSNPMPSANAPSSSAGAMATDFSTPRTSVNHSRMNRTSRSSIARSTYSCCLSIGDSLVVLRSAGGSGRHCPIMAHGGALELIRSVSLPGGAMSDTAPDAASEGVPVPKRVRVHHLRQAKERGEPITMLTAYDAVTARIFDEAGIDVLLVGDSIGNVMHGRSTTIPVTAEEMVPAVRAVSSAVDRALVVADLPFGSYEADPRQCFETATRMLKDAGAHAVKFEGGAHLSEHVECLTRSGCPVVAHLGFTPQSENLLGGKRVQGRTEDAVERLVGDALALAEAGAVAVVLEMVPAPVAARVTEVLDIP